jgi:hypothetical protein
MSDKECSWPEVVAARLRETPCRYGFETEDAAKIRRQNEREDGALVIDRLRAEVARLTAERDEARRMACEYEARYEEERCYPLDPPNEGHIQRDMRSISTERGWHCFEVQP